MELEIRGEVASGLESVAEAFESAFEGKPDMGASLSIHIEGEEVVNLWAGQSRIADKARWEKDTLGVIFSCTKGLVAILAAQLVEQGLLSYEAKVVDYWPEFGAHGKQNLTVAQLLSHKAGLSAPRKSFTPEQVLDWNFVVSSLADQQPLWEPGSGHAYHALTYGWLAGELIRRASGKSPGTLLQKQIAQPLDVEAWIGLPEALHAKAAELIVGDSLFELTAEQQSKRDPSVEDWNGKSMTLGGAFTPELAGDNSGFNNKQVREAEIPGAGGIASAQALSVIWSSVVTKTRGIRLLKDETVELATQVQSQGKPVWEVPEPWPKYGMGFQLDSEARRYSTPEGFGHDGAGGQVSFANPAKKIGFAFLTNQMEAIGDVRATKIIDALNKSLR